MYSILEFSILFRSIVLLSFADGDVAKVMEDVTLVTVTSTESVNGIYCLHLKSVAEGSPMDQI